MNQKIPIYKLPRKRQDPEKNEDNSLKKIGAILQKKRVNLGLTQAYMSELSGLQKKTISRIESGHEGVRWGTLIRYLETLNLEMMVCDDAGEPI